MELPRSTINTIIASIFAGEISVNNLPVEMYAFTFSELDGMLQAAFGKPEFQTPLEFEKAVNYRNNISRFSGAKTFQEIADLTRAAFDEDGKKRSFREFKEIARGINEKYNVSWLKTEQDTVFLQSQNARKWIKAEEQRDIFPILEYQAVGDDRTRPSHRKLDGFRARVNDPIWNKIHPQNGWRCRCNVIQLTEGALPTKEEAEAITKPILQDFKKDSEFAHNPGKVDYIFKEAGKGKHDYFKVPKEYREDLIGNFGF